MKYINLTNEPRIFNGINYETVQCKLFEFGGMEPHVKLSRGQTLTDITIYFRFNTFKDYGVLCCVVDALNNYDLNTDVKIHLNMGYMPGARQDGILNSGECFTAKVYADLINRLNFKTVTILDCHSNVAVSLLNNCINKTNYMFVYNAIKDIYKEPNFEDNMLLISPDAGSNKKIFSLARFLGYNKDIIRCDKIRDISTGNIEFFDVLANDLDGKDCLIVDDICSNGGTFLGLASELKKRNAGRLFLIVSHGEFGHNMKNSLDKLTNVFECIYTTNSMGDLIEMDEHNHVKYFKTTFNNEVFSEAIVNKNKLKVIKQW